MVLTTTLCDIGHFPISLYLPDFSFSPGYYPRDTMSQLNSAMCQYFPISHGCHTARCEPAHFPPISPYFSDFPLSQGCHTASSVPAYFLNFSIFSRSSHFPGVPHKTMWAGPFPHISPISPVSSGVAQSTIFGFHLRHLVYNKLLSWENS